jgi:hypothetical protein
LKQKIRVAKRGKDFSLNSRLHKIGIPLSRWPRQNIVLVSHFLMKKVASGEKPRRTHDRDGPFRAFVWLFFLKTPIVS